MKIREYLSDRKFFILFYIVLMTFISLVALLDSNFLSYDNLLYINLVGFFLFIFYLIAGFLYTKRYFDLLEEIISDKDRDIIYHLPVPSTNQQKLFDNLIKKLYNEQKSIIVKLNLEKKENKEFVTTWFHEIKTPIAVSRLIMEDSGEKTRNEIIKNLSEEIDKIESQVEQALYYSKIDVFEKDYFIQEIELGKIIKDVIKKQARIFISKKIQLEMPEIILKVQTDKKWLAFIIDQIISNSLKYTERGGKISIWSEEENGRKTLYIRDNGIGIKPEDLERVFDQGFTGYIGRREEKSTGIGLYLARKLARRLGHEVTIDSKYGEYTEVKIIFPRLSDYYDTVE